jgi:hypothetical protein
LESGDLEEYNQCQSRLQEMKRRGIAISADEFHCYRILHALYRGNKLEVISTLRDIARHETIVSLRLRHLSIVVPNFFFWRPESYFNLLCRSESLLFKETI